MGVCIVVSALSQKSMPASQVLASLTLGGVDPGEEKCSDLVPAIASRCQDVLYQLGSKTGFISQKNAVLNFRR